MGSGTERAGIPGGVPREAYMGNDCGGASAARLVGAALTRSELSPGVRRRSREKGKGPPAAASSAAPPCGRRAQLRSSGNKALGGGGAGGGGAGGGRACWGRGPGAGGALRLKRRGLREGSGPRQHPYPTRKELRLQTRLLEITRRGQAERGGGAVTSPPLGKIAPEAPV